ncbi:MAG TPA: FecR domain-containing protein, partial [Cytophagaceae bacterium]
MRKSPEELDKIFSKLKDDEVLPSEREFEKLFHSLDIDKAQKSKKETQFLLKIAAGFSLILIAAIFFFKSATENGKVMSGSVTKNKVDIVTPSADLNGDRKDIQVALDEKEDKKPRMSGIVKPKSFTTKDAREEIKLADGSVIILNKNSRLKTEADFGGTNRTVYLTGEAFFDVKKDASIPFIIYTTSSKTKVIGTSFNIRSEANKSEEISVVSGKVNYKIKGGNGDSLLLVAGNKCTIEHNSLKKIESFDVNLLAWKDDKIVFEKTSLKDVVNDLEYYFDIDIKVTNEEILNCKYTGSFEKP